MGYEFEPLGEEETKVFKIKIINEDKLAAYYMNGTFRKVLLIKGKYKDLGPARQSTIYVEAPLTTMIAYDKDIFEITEMTKKEYLDNQSQTPKG